MSDGGEAAASLRASGWSIITDGAEKLKTKTGSLDCSMDLAIACGSRGASGECDWSGFPKAPANAEAGKGGGGIVLVVSSSSSSAIKEDRSFDGSFGRDDLLPNTDDFEPPPNGPVGEVGDPNDPFKAEGPALEGTIMEGFGKGASEGSMISDGFVYNVPFDISSSSISSISTERVFFFGCGEDSSSSISSIMGSSSSTPNFPL